MTVLVCVADKKQKRDRRETVGLVGSKEAEEVSQKKPGKTKTVEEC
jgi:hypothetical protein